SVCGTSGQSTLRLIREVPLVGLSQGQNVGLRAKRWSRRDSHRRRANPTFDCDHPSLYPRLPFDPVKDFTPITQLCFTANVPVVHTDVPAKSVAELTALARAQPGKLTYGSAGVGTTQHLSGELYKAMAGLDIQHVPYRGIAAVMPDLLGGRLTMVFSSPVSA